MDPFDDCSDMDAEAAAERRAMTITKDVEIECEVKLKTERAYLINDGKREAWIPISMVSDSCEDSKGHITSIFIPLWLATDKGLV